jgi:hypothetical protein
MDLRALMQKLETIDKKQIVTESVETKKVITESVAPVRQSTVPVFKSSIARGIVEQFGYEVEESTLTENPHASDPAKSAAWAALSPEDQKWLGGADPTDKFILARAPNKGKPAVAPATSAATGVGNPGEEAAAQAAADKMATTSAATGVGNPGEEAAAQAAADKMATTSAATGVGNPGEEAAAQAAADKADAAAGATDMSMGQAGAANAAQTAALASGAQDDVTGVDKAVAANAARPATATAAAPTGGTAASPAKPKPTPDPKVMAMQQELIKKGAKIKADGILGPATAAAQKQFGAPGTDLSGRMTAATDPRVVGGKAASPAPAPYNAAKDSQAASAAMAKPAPTGGTAASPAAPVDPTKLSVSQRIATQPSIIDQGRAKLGIPAGGTSPAKESVVRQDDAVLAMIRNIRV